MLIFSPAADNLGKRLDEIGFHNAATLVMVAKKPGHPS